MSLADQIIAVESGGDPNAKNPNSTASGPAQFIDSTWLSTVRAHRPDLAGRSDSELLALKSDPALSRQMADAYASDNAAILAKAGLPVTPGTTYLAHFAGPQGAVGLLKADPSAPISAVLSPEAVKANPFLQNMTVSDLRAWADRKMGTGGKTQVAQAAPQPSAPASISAIPTQTQAPIFAQAATAPMQPTSIANAPSFFGGLPVQAAAAPPPIFAPPRKPIDLTRLRAALQEAPVIRGFSFTG